jgi:prepilin signal peptidase PulO-like enzyme (type II secretory pathway)
VINSSLFKKCDQHHVSSNYRVVKYASKATTHIGGLMDIITQVLDKLLTLPPEYIVVLFSLVVVLFALYVVMRIAKH